MKRTRKFRRLLLCTALLASLLLSVLAAPGCDKSEDGFTSRNDFLYELMGDWYLWYQEIPDVDPESFATPEELLDAIRYQPIDVWSYVATKEEFESYFQDAEYVGYGFSFQFDEEEKMRISFVYETSPMYLEGVRRGWSILNVDGMAATPEADLDALFGADEAGVQQTFTMEDNDAGVSDYTFAKQVIDIDTIFAETIFEIGEKKVGYFVFNNFIENSYDQLEDTLFDMRAQGIEELILDLRYNGGGLVDVANFLASSIGGSTVEGQIFADYIHNDKRSSENQVLPFMLTDYALELTRVFFITTQSTASASELVINGLDPFMEVYLVGDEQFGAAFNGPAGSV